MSTRALVAAPITREGEVRAWKGRYVHFDGYPGGVGLELLWIVQRDGVSVSRRTLVDQARLGWSTLDALAGDPNGRAPYGTHELVPGCGYRYNDLDGEQWLSSDDSRGQHSGIQWGYLLADDGLVVMRPGEDGWADIATVPWHHPDPAAAMAAIEAEWGSQ